MARDRADVSASDDAGAAGPRSLSTALRSDLRTSPWRQRLALLAVAAWLAYEWGPGNETVTPWLLARVIGAQDSIAVIPMTAAIGFAFTAAQQLASGVTALAGFSLFHRTAAAAWTRLGGDTEDAPSAWERLSLPARGVLVFGLGTTAVALAQIMTTGEVGVRRHLAVVVRAALLCGAIVAVLGGGVAALAHAGREIDVLSAPTEWLIRILGNPLLWLGILVIGIAVRRILRSPTPTVD